MARVPTSTCLSTNNRTGRTVSSDVAWHLTGQLSPRAAARVAVPDIDGQLSNDYAGSRQLATPAPAAPWAMHLAGSDRRFRHLAFDFDAKGTHTPDDAHDAATQVAARLHAAGLQPVICASGPSGGRHVWASLADSVDPDTVATLARLLKAEHPCLDIAPLTNPATGCVRPPGAPHRHGGVSEVLSGQIQHLLTPVATGEQVRELVQQLAAETTTTTAPASSPGPLPVDEHGRLHLPGPRRALPVKSAQALQEDAACGDASAVLWRVLIGAAAAHWRWADIAELVGSAPGLEHVRSIREGSRRVPRPEREQTAVLRRQWDKAVRWVASAERQVGDDPSFDRRAGELADHVRAVQERAGASVGRWVQGSGPSDRRVLDALCSLALQAVSAVVEADVRRVGMLTGLSRDTVARSLHRLAEHGWILRVQASEGPRAAHWSIDPRNVIPRSESHALTQADPRPLGSGSAERSLLLETFAHRLEAGCHDLFTTGRGGLGALAGNLYAQLSHQEHKSTLELAASIGAGTGLTRQLLVTLAAEAVILHSEAGWILPAVDARDRAARVRGVNGVLAGRAALYRLERALWAWWLSEQAWMSSAGSVARQGPQLGVHAVPGLSTCGRYPRHERSGRGDHHQARQILAAGTTRIGAPRGQSRLGGSRAYVAAA